MRDGNWRENVAELLTEAGKAIAAQQDKRATQLLGTGLVYLEKARALGERGAADILERLRGNALDNPTDRFTFAPGELEAIKNGGDP